MAVGKIKRAVDEIGVRDKFLGAALVHRHGHRKISGVIVGEGMKAEADLLEVVKAGDAFGALLAAGERGQEQRGQNGDDGNDREEFDERKRVAPANGCPGFHACVNKQQPCRGDFRAKAVLDFADA